MFGRYIRNKVAKSLKAFPLLQLVRLSNKSNSWDTLKLLSMGTPKPYLIFYRNQLYKQGSESWRHHHILPFYILDIINLCKPRCNIAPHLLYHQKMAKKERKKSAIEAKGQCTRRYTTWEIPQPAPGTIVTYIRRQTRRRCCSSRVFLGGGERRAAERKCLVRDEPDVDAIVVESVTTEREVTELVLRL